MNFRHLSLALLALIVACPAVAAPERQNPFLVPSARPYHAPPFDQIQDSDFQPALEQGMRDQDAEVDAIANSPDAPTFDNTIVALEKSGALLSHVDHVFEALTQADTNPARDHLQALEAPRLTAHRDAILQNAKLFARVQALYDQRAQLNLDPVSDRLLELTYRRFVRAGAKLGPEDQARLRSLNKEEAALMTTFHQNVIADRNRSALLVTNPAQLRGLSAEEVATAAEAARGRKLHGWLFELENTTQQPVLAHLQDRALRERLMHLSEARNDHGGPHDNRAIIIHLAELRAQRAKLLGFPTSAAYGLELEMAKTPENAEKALTELVPPSTKKARGEAADMSRLIDGRFKLSAADWEYYAEKVRKQRYNLDDAQVRPYLELNRVLHDGVFFAANRLYGLTFKERHDIPVYHQGVRVFEVFDADGSSLALLYLDYFQRPSKSGGAWEDSFIDQNGLTGEKPVIFNVLNIPPPAPGHPCLLAWDDVHGMFHEFGHALHAMLSNVRYPSLAGTNTPRDFVEFPSQFNEHWASDPTVFAHYARHYRTGVPMPAALVARIKRSKTFDQGYMTTEYLSAALLDLAWHTISPGTVISNADEFEASALRRFGVDLPQVPPRYRSTYFSHIWDGGYDAGYYAYLWSEILDHDAYYWFKAHGDLTRENGQRFRDMILSKGNSQDVAELYRAFAGRDPSVKPLLIERGLDQPRP